MIKKQIEIRVNSSNMLRLKNYFDNERKLLNKSTRENEVSPINPNMRKSTMNNYSQSRPFSNNPKLTKIKPSITFKKILRTVDFPPSDISKTKTHSIMSIHNPATVTRRANLIGTLKSPNENMRSPKISLPLKSKINSLKKSEKLQLSSRQTKNFHYEDVIKVNRLTAVKKSERNKQENCKKNEEILIKTLDDITESEDIDYIEAKYIFYNDYLKDYK